jgi:glutaredoxin-related protein
MYYVFPLLNIIKGAVPLRFREKIIRFALWPLFPVLHANTDFFGCNNH